MEQTALGSNPLGTVRSGKLTVRFTAPSIIALVLNSLYNTRKNNRDDRLWIKLQQSYLYPFYRVVNSSAKKIDMAENTDVLREIENIYGNEFIGEIILANILLDKFQIETKK